MGISAMCGKTSGRASRCLLIVLAAWLAALGAPPAGATEAGQFPMTIENCGQEVTIPKAPERVMVIAAEAASLMWAAGAADQITTYATYGEPLGPAEDALRAVPETLPADNLSKEIIVGQQPDVVIAWGFDATTREELTDVGLPTLIISGYCIDEGGPQSKGDFDAFEGIYADIELYGQLFGTEEHAAETVADLRKRVAAVEARHVAPKGSEAAVLQVYKEGPLAGYGNRSPVHAQLRKLDLENAFADVDEFYFEPSVEELIARDPDVLIALYGYRGVETADNAKAELSSRSEISGLTALREDKIVTVNYQYTGAGYLAVEGLEIMADQLAALQ